MTHVQGSLFGSGELAIHGDHPVRRTWLDAHCWIDEVHGWLGGQMELFDRLARADIWHRAERPMYGRMVLEPRLSAGLRAQHPHTPAIVRRMASELAGRYSVGMGGIWLNWYRDGQDAVAWHADRIGRAHKEPPVAIVSLGSTRRFLLRPKGGGSSVTFSPAGGDLLVMGGACQHRWEHALPRSRHGGPRISVTFRPTTPRKENQEDWAPGRVTGPASTPVPGRPLRGGRSVWSDPSGAQPGGGECGGAAGGGVEPPAVLAAFFAMRRPDSMRA